jgi:hypothetical protein
MGDLFPVVLQQFSGGGKEKANDWTERQAEADATTKQEKTTPRRGESRGNAEKSA